MWAMIGKVAGGLAVGALVGALCVATGGGAAAFVAGVVIGAAVDIAADAIAGDGEEKGLIGRALDGIDDLLNDIFPPEVTGVISVSCSPNVFTNNIPAARAIAGPESGADDDNIVICSRHDPRPDQHVAEGSSTVYINDAPAHRVQDSSTCAAKTKEGSPNVYIGGAPQATREIAPEMPAILRALDFAGKAARFLAAARKCKLNWKSIGSKVVCLGKSILGGQARAFATDVASGGIKSGVKAIATAIGSPVHAASGAKFLNGEDDTDFSFPARLPLEWTRRYNSLDTRVGLLGPGWSTPVSLQLKLNDPGEHPTQYIDGLGREIPFSALAPGESLVNTAEGYKLSCTEGGRYLVSLDDDSLHYDFGPARAPGAHTLNLLGIEDNNGNALNLLHDKAGRLQSISDSARRVYRCHYDPRHPERLAGITLENSDDDKTAPPDWLVRYTYDARARLIAVTDRAGSTTREFGWHDSGPGTDLLARHTLPEGLTAHYQWASFADHPRVVEHWDDTGRRWRFEYDTEAGTTRVTDQQSRSQHWRWTSRYELLGYTNAVGEQWQFERNATDQLIALTQPNGGQWRFTYDARGNLASETDPQGNTTRTEWQVARTLPERDIDAAGRITEYTHDWFGNLIEIKDSTGSTTWQLDRYGQPLVRTAANGSTTRWNWNDAGQPIEHIDCSEQLTASTYDRDGNPLSVTDALGQSSHYQHDALGRLLEARLPDNTRRQWQWSTSGQLTATVDGKGYPTHYHWQQGRLTRRTDAAGRHIDYHYDTPGNLTGLTNENHETYQFEHDPAGRQIAQIALDGKRTELTLDPLGQPIEIREAAGTPSEILTRLERDLLGRLTRKTTPETITTYTRDPVGQLTRIERTTIHLDPLDTHLYTYDGAGNLLTETRETHPRPGEYTQPRPPQRQTLTHTYDALGNRLSTTLPDGRTIQSLYYGSGHLHQINFDGQTITDIERDALHRETRRTQGSRALHTRYDPLSRIRRQRSQIDTYQSEELPDGLDKRYQYDRDGELMRRHDTLWGQIDHAHDNTGRIIGQHTVREGRAQPIHEQHRYDPAANLLTDGNERGFVLHNRIQVFEDKRYTYDEHGRLTEKQIGSHTHILLKWNREHQLIESVTTQNGDRRRCQYEYDALGRRTAKRSLFGSVDFLWDGMRLLQERRQHQTVTYLYQPNSYEPLARIDDTDPGYKHPTVTAKIYHFHTHINGAPEELTDVGGTVVWRARYRTWGNLALQEATEPRLLPNNDRPTSPQALRLQGQYADSETGLYYNTFRYYDPDVGRFISEDPIGLEGGLNLYQFAANADSWIDPWGWAPSTTTVYHYTSPEAYRAITSGSENGNLVFKGGKTNGKHPEKSGVWVSTLSPDDLRKEPNAFKKKLGLTNDKTMYHFKMDVPTNQLKDLTGGRGDHVKIIPGNFVIRKDNVTHGPTPGRSTKDGSRCLGS
jgi:RHS repeat-associated protein